jgi:hypothetical protein
MADVVGMAEIDGVFLARQWKGLGGWIVELACCGQIELHFTGSTHFNVTVVEVDTLVSVADLGGLC